MVKGYNHNIYNNTSFDNGDKNDIIIMIDQGGNEGTITVNNAANKIAGHRTGSYESYPVPGNYENNWNGYETDLNIKDFLEDTDNYDFRRLEGSVLIDNGMVYNNLDISYSGSNPDIGAYEYGGEYWIPGITWDVVQEFGEDFILPDSLPSLLGDINQDTYIDVLDIVLIVNHITGNMLLNDVQLNLADFNSDSLIDVLDIVQIINIILN